MSLVLMAASAGELADAIENWIIDNKCNPSTPEEWDRCLSDLAKQGAVSVVGTVSSTKNLKEELGKDFNTKEL